MTFIILCSMSCGSFSLIDTLTKNYRTFSKDFVIVELKERNAQSP